MKVLLLESHTKHALAVIRSLGDSGYTVVCDVERFNPNIFSKYCSKAIRIKSISPKEIINIVRSENIDVLLPIGYESTLNISKIKDDISKYVMVPVDEYNKILNIVNKTSLYYMLKSDKKIKIPKTVVIHSLNDIEKIDKLRFPVVIKNTIEGYRKKYSIAYSKSKIRNEIVERLRFSDVIVQEYVVGEGRGFFGLCKNGKMLAYFQHRRIREFPASGGVSSFSESIFDRKLLSLGKRIAKKTKIDMHFMAEFKYNLETRKYTLIEINLKFWGSLDLAIKSGVDFPKLVIKKALGEPIKFRKYKTGVKYQWCFPEDFARIFTCKTKINCLKDFIKTLFDRDVFHDVDYINSDPLPTILRSLRGIAYGVSLGLRKWK